MLNSNLSSEIRRFKYPFLRFIINKKIFKLLYPKQAEEQIYNSLRMESIEKIAEEHLQYLEHLHRITEKTFEYIHETTANWNAKDNRVLDRGILEEFNKNIREQLSLRIKKIHETINSATPSFSDK